MTKMLTNVELCNQNFDHLTKMLTNFELVTKFLTK